MSDMTPAGSAGICEHGRYREYCDGALDSASIISSRPLARTVSGHLDRHALTRFTFDPLRNSLQCNAGGRARASVLPLFAIVAACRLLFPRTTTRSIRHSRRL